VYFKRSRLVALAAVLASTYPFFLGGGFTTIAFLPAWLRDVSKVVPTRYAIDGIRQALFYPDLQDFGHDMAVLLGFAAASSLIAAYSWDARWTERVALPATGPQPGCARAVDTAPPNRRARGHGRREVQRVCCLAGGELVVVTGTHSATRRALLGPKPSCRPLSPESGDFVRANQTSQRIWDVAGRWAREGCQGCDCVRGAGR
jgi:hypothetical protein